MSLRCASVSAANKVEFRMPGIDHPQEGQLVKQQKLADEFSTCSAYYSLASEVSRSGAKSGKDPRHVGRVRTLADAMLVEALAVVASS